MGPFSSVLVASFTIMVAATMVAQNSEQFVSRLSGVWLFILLAAPIALPVIGACVVLSVGFIVLMAISDNSAS